MGLSLLVILGNWYGGRKFSPFVVGFLLPYKPKPVTIMKKTIYTILCFLTLAPLSTSAALNKDLRQGMKNADVVQLQTILADKGYLNRALANGLFGTATVQAVKKYQIANKIPSTGTVGPLTRALMNKVEIATAVKTAELPIKNSPVIPVGNVQLNISEVKQAPIDYTSLVDFNSIKTEDALKYVNVASRETGVPADLLLKILKVESSNKTKCYLTNSPKGLLSDGVGAIKPNRDLGPFFTLTKNLGTDPYGSAVSCKDGLIGGGFIASTWMSIGPKLNPWNPQDVAMAYAQYLLQAGGGSYNEARVCKLMYGGGCPWNSIYYAPQGPAPVIQDNSEQVANEQRVQAQINDLQQQILDIKKKYYQDVSNAYSNPEWSSDTAQGWVNRITNEANLKIDQLNLKIQQYSR